MLTKLRQQKDKLIARALLRYPALFKMWEKKSDTLMFDKAPWKDLEKPVADSKLALITTGGVHLRQQQPFNMDDPDGDATFREIPVDIATEELMITHNYYDHTDADQDINVVFPLERVRFLRKANEIGKLTRYHYAFMGHILRGQLELLLKHTIPQLVDRLHKEQVDIVIMSPA